MSNNKEAQEDELLALTSIYDEEEFHRAESAQGGEIQLCLELPADFKIVVKGRPVRMVCIIPECTAYSKLKKYVSMLQGTHRQSIMSASCLHWCSTLNYLKTIPLNPHQSSL